MAIKIGNQVVIDDSRNWAGNTISTSSLEYGGSTTNSSSSNITLTSSSEQVLRVTGTATQVSLPDPSLISGGFERFVIINEKTSNLYVVDYAGVKNLLKPAQFAICTAIANSWKITTSTNDGENIYINARTIVNGGTNDASNLISVGLNSNKALISYRKTSSGGFVSVLSVTNNTITEGTPLLVASASLIDTRIKLAAVDENTVIALYRNSSGTDLFARVLVISGTTVSADTPITISSNCLSLYDIKMISATKALVIYYDTSNAYTRGVTLDISGTTLTVNTYHNLVSGNVADTLVLLNSTRAVMYRMDANSLYAFSISGNTLTYVNQTNIDSSNGAAYMSVIALESASDDSVTKCIIAYHSTSESYKMRARSVYINASGIYLLGDSRIISDETIQYSATTMTKLDANKFMIVLKSRYNLTNVDTSFKLCIFDVKENITTAAPIESQNIILRARSRDRSGFTNASSLKHYQIIEKSAYSQPSLSAGDGATFCKLDEKKFIFSYIFASKVYTNYVEFNPSNTD